MKPQNQEMYWQKMHLPNLKVLRAHLEVNLEGLLEGKIGACC